jgi:hypothetical protein
VAGALLVHGSAAPATDFLCSDPGIAMVVVMLNDFRRSGSRFG